MDYIMMVLKNLGKVNHFLINVKLENNPLKQLKKMETKSSKIESLMTYSNFNRSNNDNDNISKFQSESCLNRNRSKGKETTLKEQIFLENVYKDLNKYSTIMTIKKLK